mmetsp:Transcript_115965/g.369975  ORF Transcript_115965/g.369975 Transcript_115965/m.369975 type:complete len:245 (-) Transcript_115965:195-929(-)
MCVHILLAVLQQKLQRVLCKSCAHVHHQKLVQKHGPEEGQGNELRHVAKAAAVLLSRQQLLDGVQEEPAIDQRDVGETAQTGFGGQGGTPLPAIPEHQHRRLRAPSTKAGHGGKQVACRMARRPNIAHHHVGHALAAGCRPQVCEAGALGGGPGPSGQVPSLLIQVCKPLRCCNLQLLCVAPPGLLQAGLRAPGSLDVGVRAVEGRAVDEGLMRRHGPGLELPRGDGVVELLVQLALKGEDRAF